MTLLKIFEIASYGANEKITEIEMILKIQKITNVNFLRACTGYKKMRESGMINDVIDKNTIGHLETLEANKALMLVISRFEAIPTNIQTSKLKRTRKKHYQPHEVMPFIKLTPIETAVWLSG